ncbi:MAG: right-handed parallel beta-helix repeat-containing protein [Myxococcota bacterium]
MLATLWLPSPWLALSLTAPSAHAASSEVGPGDDLNTVLSSLQPGDVITFTGGTYDLDGTLYWTGVGTAEEPIEFRALAGSPVILQNNGGGYVAQITDSQYLNLTGITFQGGGDIEYTQPSGMYIANSSNVTMQDCTVTNVWGTALRIDGNASNLTIAHNELSFTGDGSAIYVGCGDASCWMQDSTIEFNLIHDVQGNGIYLSPGTQASTLQHNVIFRADDTAIVLTSTEFGPQNLVYGNAIWQTEDDGIYVEGAALIQNNLLFEIGGDGITSRSSYESLYDVQISHNTVGRTEGWAANLQDWYDREDLVFSNNALSNPTGLGLFWDDLQYNDDYGYGTTTTSTYPDTANYISNNVVTGLVDGFDELQRPTYVIPGGGVADFVDIENFDYYPTAVSLVRDAADPNGNAYIPAEDFNGTARDGTSPDAGAYEYDGDGNPGWILQEDFKEFSPSEGRNSTGVSSGCCGAKKNEPSGTGSAALLVPVGVFGLLRRRARRGR